MHSDSHTSFWVLIPHPMLTHVSSTENEATLVLHTEQCRGEVSWPRSTQPASESLF